jgi:hypothetical protein
VQIPVDGIASANFTASQNMTRFGDPILWNTAFQYHLWEYFWPELEVNYTFWPNGIHKDLSQVLLTPGIIFGRFKIGQDSPTRPINLIIGAGYQFAVTSDPVGQKQLGGYASGHFLDRRQASTMRLCLAWWWASKAISIGQTSKGRFPLAVRRTPPG